MNFLARLFSSSGFMPHGHCYLWEPGVMWLHVVSDSLIALAYLTIPMTLIYIARKRKDLPFDWMFVCFGVFILACGTTHALEVWTLWNPTYWLSGVVKAVTAAASLATAVLLAKLIPQLLAIPSPSVLAHANDALRREITERRRAEDERQESQTHLQLALEASNIGPWGLDLATRKPYFSPEWKRQLGYGETEIRHDFSEFSSRLHPEDAPHVQAALDLYLADPGRGYDVEFRMRHRDGSYRWIHTRGSLQCDREGRPVRVLGCHLDTTERRNTAEKLKEAKVATTRREGEQRYTFLADSIPQIVWTARADGGVEYFNKAWISYTGLTFAQSLEWGWAPVLHPDDLQPCLDRWKQSLGSGEAYEVEYRFRRASDGAYRWHLGRGLPMRDEQGEIVQWVGTCTDIDDAKRSEEALVAANNELNLRVTERTAELNLAKETAEAASRSKSEFLANMSHEIRTPMNGIIGMTDLALETDLDREQREYLGMVKTSAHGLLALINDILDFSKIEAGKLELEAISFNLRDCLGATLKPLGLRAAQKGLELTADLPADVPDPLIGDPMRLRQILINLIDNAIKFTPQGDVTLRVEVESGGDAHTCLHFSVSDTGIGIPADKQALIFEAFAQADGTTTRTYGGTGLGLAIATQLVRHMGGRLWLESSGGVGTTFHFTACLPVQQTAAPDVRHAEATELEGMRVLVVDDNAINRRILREMLTNWRMQPAVSPSGAEALTEMLGAARGGAPFPLVLLDGMMPGMDGFALVEKIREHAELADATVMMLCSAIPAGAAARCAELRVASYLTKPVFKSELLEAILAAMGETHDAEVAGDDALPGVPLAAGRLRVLLAEDNVINRALATTLLEKQGHAVTHASTGREAVELAAGGNFDLIFMDVQMPEMDGLEATRRIRSTEGGTGRRTPIAAMTAHAMAGDRERCLAAGMNDYLSKPIQKPELLALIQRVTASRKPADSGRVPSTPAAPPAAGAPAAAPAVYPRAKLLDQLDGDEELLRRMVTLFDENTPQVLDSIRQAVARRAPTELAQAAHRLLSSLGAFGAEPAHALTLELEAQARREDFTDTARVFAALEVETARIHAALDVLVPTRD